MARCTRVYSRSIKGTRNNGSPSYKDLVTYAYTFGNYGICSKPTSVADGNRSVRELCMHSSRIENVIMVEDTHVGANHRMLTNGDERIRVDADICVAIHMVMALQHRVSCHLNA